MSAPNFLPNLNLKQRSFYFLLNPNALLLYRLTNLECPPN